MEQNFIHALLSGDKNAIFGVGSALILTFFGAWLFKWIMTNFSAGIDAARTKWNTWNLGWITQVGNNFLDKCNLALANTVHSQAVLAEKLADGVMTPAEWQEFAEAAWSDVKANIGLHEWQDLGSLLVPSFSAKHTSRDEVEKAAKAKFLSVARGMGADHAERSITKRTMRRALAGPTPSPEHLHFAREVAMTPVETPKATATFAGN